MAHANDPVHPISTGPWFLWAHRETEKSGRVVYRHIGYEKWTRLHGGQAPVVAIRLTEDPDGAYWGWLDSNRDHAKPTLVYPSKLLFEMCFSSGSARAIEGLASRGHIGKVVRLSVIELGSRPA
jgi:hypothetical protein